MYGNTKTKGLASQESVVPRKVSTRRVRTGFWLKRQTLFVWMTKLCDVAANVGTVSFTMVGKVAMKLINNSHSSLT